MEFCYVGSTTPTAADIADKLFNASLMLNVRQAAQSNPAFMDVAEEAVGKAVRYYSKLVQRNAFFKRPKGRFAWNAPNPDEQAELARKAAATERLKRIAKRRGVHGAHLLYLLIL